MSKHKARTDNVPMMPKINLTLYNFVRHFSSIR